MANTIKFKRASGSDPSASDLAIGEPGLRTDTAELFFKKDDGTVAKVSGGGGGPNFKYLELRNAANNGAASFPGNDFTLVTAGTTTAISPSAANTLLVSVSGVIQKPNAGTSTSGITGFIVDGSRFKTATNLPAAPDFIVYQESGGIGEPSDNTVTSAKIVDGAIVNADINASAAIAGTKISPSFTSNITITNSAPKISFTDTNADSDFEIKGNAGKLEFIDTTNSRDVLSLNSDGHVDVFGNLDVGAGLDVTGAIKSTGNISLDNSSELGVFEADTSLGFTNSAKLSFDFSSNLARIRSSGNGSFSTRPLTFNILNTEAMRIDTSGRLLIGGSSSQSQYSSQSSLQVQGTEFHDSTIALRRDQNNANPPGVIFAKSRSGSIGGNTIVQNGDQIGTLLFAAADGNDLTSLAAEIKVQIDGVPGSNDVPGRMSFHTTADGAASPTERMRIDSSGRLLLGTTNEGISNADDLTIATSGHTGLTIRSGTSNQGNIFFSDGTSGTDEFRGYIQYEHTSNALIFGTDATERMRILSGGGITFNGDTAAANALDDYEEGTWTPVFNNVNTPTFNSQTGRYTKIGRFIYLTGTLDVASGLDTSDGSAVAIGGLPFTGNNDDNSCLFSFGKFTSLMSNSRLETVTNFRFNGTNVMLHRGNNTDINYTLMNSSGKLEFAMSYSQ